jgi:glycosyltransferase involved in cell wall biosynthesis
MKALHNNGDTGAPLSFVEGKGLHAGKAGVRVILFSPQTLPSIGGLQYVVHYWAEALSIKGYQVTVISETPEQANASSQPQRGDSPIRGVQPYDQTHQPHAQKKETPDLTSQPDNQSTSQPGYTILRNLPFFQQVAVMRKADRIIMFNVSLKGMPAWLLSGKALYLSHHTALWYENGPRPWQQRLKQWVANYMAKKNCACSGYIASLYKRCEVIYSPFRSDVFVPGTAPRIPGSILFAGRLVSDKGADLLLEAFALLQKTPSSPSTYTGSPLKGESEGQPTLTLAGSGPDLPLLEQKVKSLGISRQVHFTGSLLQSELVRLMQTSQIMVVPSRMEPMGMVVAEGLACGCRMVVSNQGGMPEVGGPFCHYFESGNAAALAVALETALTNPLPVNAHELDAHLQQFTIDYSVAKLEEWLGV